MSKILYYVSLAITQAGVKLNNEYIFGLGGRLELFSDEL